MDTLHPTAAPRATGTPEWLVNLSAFGWRVLVVALLVAAVLLIAQTLIVVIASIVVALLIAASLQPLMTALRRRGTSAAAAAEIVTTTVVAVVTIAVIVVALAFAPYIADVLRNISAGLDNASSAAAGSGLPSDAARTLSSAIASVKDTVSTTASSIGSTIATIVTVAILAAILTFFFLRDGLKALAHIVPPGTRHRRDIIGLVGRRAIPSAGRFMRTQAVYAAIDAGLAWLFLTLLGVPLAAPLAMLVFLGGFVPYLGFPVVAAGLALVALSTNGAQTAAVLLALVGGMYWLTRRTLPQLVKPEPTGFSPATVLIAVLVFSAFGGYAGMVAAVPTLILGRAAADAMVLVLDPGPGAARATILVPGWLDRLADLAWQFLVVGALLMVGVGVLLAFPIVMLPLLIAVVLAAPLAPFVSSLVSRGWSRFRAALAVTAGTSAVVIGVIVLAVTALLAQSQNIVSTAGEGADKANSTGALGDTVAQVGAGIVGPLAGVGVALAAAAVVLILSGLLCFYLLRDGPRLWPGIVGHLPAPTRPRVTSIVADSGSILSRYMIGTGAISVFGAASQFATMFVLGLPLALPLAVLSFFGGFIPYIGSFITTGLAFLVTVATGSPFDIVVMLIFTVVFNVVTGNVVAPIVYSRAVNLHPAVVLLAIPAGNSIAGILGMFLAVPAIAIAVSAWRPILDLVGTMPPALRPEEPAAVALAQSAAATAVPAVTPATTSPAPGGAAHEQRGLRGFVHRVLRRRVRTP